MPILTALRRVAGPPLLFVILLLFDRGAIVAIVLLALHLRHGPPRPRRSRKTITTCAERAASSARRRGSSPRPCASREDSARGRSAQLKVVSRRASAPTRSRPCPGTRMVIGPAGAGKSRADQALGARVRAEGVLRRSARGARRRHARVLVVAGAGSGAARHGRQDARDRRLRRQRRLGGVPRDPGASQRPERPIQGVIVLGRAGSDRGSARGADRLQWRARRGAARGTGPAPRRRVPRLPVFNRFDWRRRLSRSFFSDTLRGGAAGASGARRSRSERAGQPHRRGAVRRGVRRRADVAPLSETPRPAHGGDGRGHRPRPRRSRSLLQLERVRGNLRRFDAVLFETQVLADGAAVTAATLRRRRPERSSRPDRVLEARRPRTLGLAMQRPEAVPRSAARIVVRARPAFTEVESVPGPHAATRESVARAAEAGCVAASASRYRRLRARVRPPARAVHRSSRARTARSSAARAAGVAGGGEPRHRRTALVDNLRTLDRLRATRRTSWTVSAATCRFFRRVRRVVGRRGARSRRAAMDEAHDHFVIARRCSAWRTAFECGRSAGRDASSTTTTGSARSGQLTRSRQDRSRGRARVLTREVVRALADRLELGGD